MRPLTPAFRVRNLTLTLALALVVAVVCAFSGGGVALARGHHSHPRQQASVKFTGHKPGSSTGTMLEIDYINPKDPQAKPPAVRRVVLTLPRGARFDTSVPGICKASDGQLMALGEAACPADSQVGTGKVTVDSGFPGPGRFVDADVTFFNNTDQLIYLNTVHDTAVRTVIRARVTRRRVITNAGMLPGTPPDGGAIDTTQTSDPPLTGRVDGHKRNYITTPKHCPPGGKWTSKLRFTYADGVTQTVKSRIRCR